LCGADHSEAYFLASCRHIELNPVRAGMVTHRRDYPWSSWCAHALGVHDKLVSDHPLHRALERASAERQKEYRALFGPAPDQTFVEALRAATNCGWALGAEHFEQQIPRRCADASRR
jgi:putative transposase